jgi:hypothetical protein
MGKDMANIDGLAVKVNCTDQAVVIASNIEDDKRIHPICGAKSLFNLGKATKARPNNNRVPSR